MLVAAALAGIDGIVAKTSGASQLLETIRSVASGASTLPPVGPALKGNAARRLDPGDHAILAMRVAGHTLAEIADTLWLQQTELARRIQTMIARLVGDRGAIPAPLGSR